jgi:hypothetical protein
MWRIQDDLRVDCKPCLRRPIQNLLLPHLVYLVVSPICIQMSHVSPRLAVLECWKSMGPEVRGIEIYDTVIAYLPFP